MARRRSAAPTAVPLSEPRPRGWLWAAILTAATLVAFSSGLKAPFYFDDLPSVLRNESIRQLTPLSVPLSPPDNTSVAGRPVVNFSLAVNFALNELMGIDQRPDPAGPAKTVGYHIVNILVHLACGLLLFGMVRRTLGTARGAATASERDLVAGFTALLWLLHPIQSQAVYYVVARTELLVSFFLLLTLYAATRAWSSSRSVRTGWSIAALVACALGMGSKEVMVVAPVVVLMYDLAFREESWTALWANRPRRMLYAGLFATTLIVVAFVALSVRGRSVGFDLGVTWYQYAYTQAWAVARYLRLIVWPSGLTFDYGEIPIAGAQGVPGLVVLAALATGTVYAWTQPRLRWLAFLGTWFFVILAPSSSVVPIRTEMAAERRVYLASAAVVLLAVLGAMALWRRLGARVRWLRMSLGGVGGALALATFARGETYLDPATLYREVITNAPSNPRGYTGAGLALFVSGPEHLDEAAGLFRQAMAVDSLNFVAPMALGWAEVTRGNFAPAESAFARVLRLRPGDVEATRGMARTLVSQDRPDSAAPYVDSLGGRDNDLLYDLGALFVDRGEGVRALPYLEPAAARQPHSAGVALLSVAYAQGGQVGRAVETAARAVAGAGDTVNVFLLAGRAMKIAGRHELAEGYLKRALALDPGSKAARQLMGLAPR